MWSDGAAALAAPRHDARSLRRTLASVLPATSTTSDEGGATLEVERSSVDPPRLIAATLLESSSLRAIRVEGEPVVGVQAFLDGTQQSRVLAHVEGAPLVEGTVAAVVRVRRDRRMATWKHLVARAVYGSRSSIPGSLWGALVDAGLPMVDTDERSTSDGAVAESVHPFILRDAAVHRVQEDREHLERQLAEEWCARQDGTLFVDGGISGSERVAGSQCVIGVVKSHRTLYAEGEGLRTVLALREGERTSVFRVTSARRSPVASWYLRLRDPSGRDPMWGLVRVEVALPPEAPSTATVEAIATRAAEVSRWVLGERSPVALPDGRWDRMAYGIRDCEEFLKAVV